MERDNIIIEDLEIHNLDEEIVYDDDSKYEPTERVFENDILIRRLYCMHEGCKKYVKGLEGYNGSFTSEAGSRVDLRNQGFICETHSNEVKS